VAIFHEYTLFKSIQKIHLKISRKRKDFGTIPSFSDKCADDLMITECRSFKDPAYEINRMELSMGVQVGNCCVTVARTHMIFDRQFPDLLIALHKPTGLGPSIFPVNTNLF
jgi:hypothetical protein